MGEVLFEPLAFSSPFLDLPQDSKKNTLLAISNVKFQGDYSNFDQFG